LGFVREMPRQIGYNLMKDEKVELISRPHPLSFMKYHFFNLYLISVAFLLGWLYIYLQSNQQLLASFSFLDTFFTIVGAQTADAIILFLFWLILILSGYVVGVLWITKKPLFYMLLVGAAGTILELYFLAPYDVVLGVVPKSIVKLILLSVTTGLAAVLTEIYRRGHTYTVTNYRVITKKDFIRKEEREVTYDNITDVYVNQGILGRIFNFGTIILVSGSGFGLGVDSAQAFTATSIPVKGIRVTGGFSGAKGVQMPRAATYFALYGIPDPKKARVIIGNRQLESKESPILRRIEGLLKDKNEK
jgi:hypothetical protein